MPQKFEEQTTDHHWVSITEEFFSHASSLGLGELIHENTFELYDAMTAVELMHPTMDSGMLMTRQNKPLSFEEALEKGLIQLDNFPRRFLIDIIDSFLSCFAAWLEGDLLIQTLFTNLYLHDPLRIKDVILKTVCFGIYKIVDAIRELLLKTASFDEEDFQPMQYGYKLNPDVFPHDIIVSFKDVEEGLYRKSPKDKEDKGVEFRLIFLRNFYQFLLHLIYDQPISLDACLNFTRILQDLLPILEDGAGCDVPWEGLGYQPLINQRMLPPTFPRYNKIRSAEKTFEYFRKIFKDVFVVLSLGKINLDNLVDFLMDFSGKLPSLIPRSILQTVYFSNEYVVAGYHIQDLLKGSLFNNFPPGLERSLRDFKGLDRSVEASEVLDNFLESCSRVFLDFFRIFGHNISRQREKLIVILRDCSYLCKELEKLEMSLCKNTLGDLILERITSWLEFNVLKFVLLYIFTGFTLDLYSDHEYLYIYWFLKDFVFGKLVFILEKYPKDPELTYYKAFHRISQGFFHIFLHFRLEKKISLPKYESTRFQHRLNPVKTPFFDFPEFSDFEKSLEMENPTCNLYLESHKEFLEAKQLLERLLLVPTKFSEVENVKMVAKNNSVVLKLLAAGFKQDFSPGLEFEICRYFPTVKIQ